MHEANPFNQDISTRAPYPLEGSPFLNRKLKLPPISSVGTNIVESNRSSLQQHRNFASLPAMDSLTLPQLDLCSLGLQNRKRGNSSKTNTRKACKDIQDNPIFSLPHVYAVLPPIGKTFVPCAPSSSRKTELHSSDIGSDNSKKHFNNDSTKRKRQSTRKSRINRHTSEESDTVTEIPVVDDKPVETTIKSSKQQNEIIAIHISDTCVMPHERESDFTSTVNKVDERRPDEEDSSPVSSNVPRELRLYVDVYPGSPTRNLRWSRVTVEKKRQDLREDNNIRLGFMESVSVNRRNATCTELDEALKNAVELLREIFLRKTMEELCMMW